VHESAVGTKLLNARALVCPEELPKADMRPFRRDSAFDPSATLAAKFVMHNRLSPNVITSTRSKFSAGRST
jgi:hypothetical protein